MESLEGGTETDGAQVHWHAGQGDKERRGGEEGVGLGQRDPAGEVSGRVDKDRGETGREPQTSWVARESLLREAVTGTEVELVGEDVTVSAVGDCDGPIGEGVRVALRGAAVSETVPVEAKAKEFGSASREAGIASVSASVGDGADAKGEGVGGGVNEMGEKGSGDVMRGIGEDGWGEYGGAGDRQRSAEAGRRGVMEGEGGARKLNCNG